MIIIKNTFAWLYVRLILFKLVSRFRSLLYMIVYGHDCIEPYYLPNELLQLFCAFVAGKHDERWIELNWFEWLVGWNGSSVGWLFVFLVFLSSSNLSNTSLSTLQIRKKSEHMKSLKKNFFFISKWRQISWHLCFFFFWLLCLPKKKKSKKKTSRNNCNFITLTCFFLRFLEFSTCFFGLVNFCCNFFFMFNMTWYSCCTVKLSWVF